MNRVNIEQARKLKELGFNKICDTWYEDFGKNMLFYPISMGNYNDEKIFKHTISAPYIAEALEWIRNEKGIMGIIDIHWNIVNLIYYWKIKYIYEKTRDIIKNKIIHDNYHTYEEAESALLDELLIILE